MLLLLGDIKAVGSHTSANPIPNATSHRAEETIPTMQDSIYPETNSVNAKGASEIFGDTE